MRTVLALLLALALNSCATAMAVDDPEERICRIYLVALYGASIQLDDQDREEALAGIEMLREVLCD